MSGGGGGQTTTQQKLAPEQSQILKMVMPILQQQMRQGATPYPGSQVAGFTPAQLQGQQSAINAATGPVQGIASSAAGASDFLTSGAVLDPNRNPGLAGAIEAGIDPLRQEYMTSVLPNIRGGAILAGQYGGSEQAESQNLASEAYLRQAGNTAANIINPAYQAGLDAYTRGLALAPQTAGLQLAPGQALAGVGGQQQAQQQAQLDDEVRRYLEQQYGDLLLAEEIASVAFGLPLGTGVTQNQGGGVSPWLSGLGGAATGAALGSVLAPGPGTAAGAGLGALLGFLG